MNKLNDDETATLLEKVIRVTREERLIWSPLNGTRFDYGATVGDFYYRVFSVDVDGVAPYCFEAHHAGSGLDDPLVSHTTAERTTPLSVLVADLYDIVERKVLGLDDLAEKMLGGLDEL